MYRKTTTSRGRRWPLRAAVAGIAALALTLTACSGGSGSPSASTPVGQRGGDLVAVIGGDPTTLNPGLTTSNDTAIIAAQVFEGLVIMDAAGKPQPELAKSWDISKDELTYTFHLRTGVTWHDGKPFTSDDVKWSFETGLKTNARAQTALKQVASIATPDAATVVITLKIPQAAFLSLMKVFDTPILPKHVYAGTDITTNPANQAPIGTGPFMFDKWNHGSSVTLKKNPNYWQAGKPYLNSVTFSVMNDAAQRTIALKTGQVDYVGAVYLARADVAQLKTEKDVVIHEQTSIPALHFMWMNETNKYLADKNVRQAIAMAIDRNRLVSQAMAGLATEGKGSFGNGFSWMYDKDVSYDKLYPLDATKAKAMLDKAGVPAGTTLRIAFDAAKAQFQAASAIIKDNLKKIGIDVTLQPMEASVFTDKVYKQHDYDLALQSFTSSGDPAIGYHRLYITTPGNTVNQNPTGYSNPKVDELLGQAASVSDLTKRAAFYYQAQDILNKDVPTLVLFDEKQADAVSSHVKGFFADLNPMDQWTDAYITK
jgi:peptide/nickel transport system substrate-binding protein